jgi:hypothetical protein
MAELRGQLGSTLAWCPEGPGFKYRLGDRLSCEAFRGYPQTLQANAGIVPIIRPRPLPSVSFPIRYS